MIAAPEVIKICPSIVFYSETPMPEFTGTTWEDLTVYFKQLVEHIEFLNQDRKEVDAYCNSD